MYLKYIHSRENFGDQMKRQKFRHKVCYSFYLNVVLELYLPSAGEKIINDIFKMKLFIFHLINKVAYNSYYIKPKTKEFRNYFSLFSFSKSKTLFLPREVCKGVRSVLKSWLPICPPRLKKNIFPICHSKFFSSMSYQIFFCNFLQSAEILAYIYCIFQRHQLR